MDQAKVMLVMIIILFIIAGIVLVRSCDSDSSDNDYEYSSGSSSNYDNSDRGFVGSDGKYHAYVPEFGDDVNNWMKENW